MDDTHSTAQGRAALAQAFAPLWHKRRAVRAAWVAAWSGFAATGLALGVSFVARSGSLTTTALWLGADGLLLGLWSAAALTARWLDQTPCRSAPKCAWPSLAMLAQQLCPSLGTAPHAAAEFASQPAGSGRLAQGHILQTAARLVAAQPGILLQERRHSLRKRLWLVSFLLGAGALFHTASDHRARLVILGLLTQKPVHLRVSENLIFDPSLIVTLPAYTQRPPYALPLGLHTVSALPGSLIQFKAMTHKPVVRAGLTFLTEPGLLQAPVVHISQDGTLTWLMPVAEPLAFGLWVDEGDGVMLEDPQAFSLLVSEDTPPTVQISVPATDVHLAAHEDLLVRWRAQDDFGCTKAQLHLSNAQGANLWLHSDLVHESTEGAQSQAFCSGSGLISSKTLENLEGEAFDLTVEVDDTCPTPRPHVGVSAVRTITRISPDEHHRLLLARQREVFEQLVDWLAETYLAPAPVVSPSALTNTVHSACVALDSLVEALDHDTLARASEREAWRHVAQHAHLADESLRQVSEAVDPRRHVRRLENDILYIDDLLSEGHLQTAQSSATHLSGATDALKELFSKLGQGEDEKWMPEIVARLKAFEKRLKDVLERASDSQNTYAPEPQNIDAQGHSVTDDTLSRMAEALKNHDAKAAAEELAHLEDMVQKMVQNLGDDKKNERSSRYKQAQQKVQEAVQNLDRLASDQQALAERINQQNQNQSATQMGQEDAALWQKAEALRIALDGHLHGLNGQIHAEALFGREMARIKNQSLELKDLLDAKQRPLAIQHATEIESTVSALGRHMLQLPEPIVAPFKQGHRQLLDTARQLRSCLATQAPTSSAAAGKKDAQKDQAKWMAQQKQLMQKLQQAQDSLGALGESMPILGDNEQNSLSTAQQKMAATSEALAHNDGPKAADTAKEAADALLQVQQAFDQTGPSQSMPQPFGRPDARRRGLGNSSSQDEVVVPHAEEQKRNQFRDDVQRAARQPAPPRYQKSVRQYHDELVR